MYVDFSTWMPRCSSLGYICGESKEKSYLEQWNEAKALKDKLENELANTSERAVKTADKLYDRIEKLEDKLMYLGPLKYIDRLSESAKTHLCDVYTAIKYGRHEDIESKYLEKGLLLEEDGITLYSKVTGKMFRKNKVRLNNGWIEGECDIDSESVKDTKVNWSIFQFTRTAAKPIKALYKWQIKGYMWLFDKPKGEVIYCLLDTPEHLIKREEMYLKNRFVGTPEDYDLACKELRHNLTYEDIPDEEKIRVFEVERNEEDEEFMKKRITTARKFLADLQDKKYNFGKDDESE